MTEPQSSATISTKLERIAKLAKDAPHTAFRTLAHHIDIEWMREAYRRTRKSGATGVDGQTAAQYAADLDANLTALLQRAKSGTYRAPPVRRVHIPKGSGRETRPLGIPTFEDKVLRRAVVMLLEPVYEQDFLDCSYGFRAGRSAHQALATLQNEITMMKGGWVVEIDIRKYFDVLDHAMLRQGYLLALLEIRMVLATLFQSFEVERIGDPAAVEEVFAFTMAAPHRARAPPAPLLPVAG